MLRRSVHLLVALAPLYYLLPAEFPGMPLRRWELLIALFAIVAVFEALRLRKGVTFVGLRPHESGSIASFMWAAAGITIALWLMPMEVATPVLVGMGLCDPLAGELRRAKAGKASQIAYPTVVYFVICFAALSLMTEARLELILVMSTVGAWLAIAAERAGVPVIDDDFLMIVVPGAFMSLLWLCL